jgi:hypothetical protein
VRVCPPMLGRWLCPLVAATSAIPWLYRPGGGCGSYAPWWYGAEFEKCKGGFGRVDIGGGGGTKSYELWLSIRRLFDGRQKKKTTKAITSRAPPPKPAARPIMVVVDIPPGLGSTSMGIGDLVGVLVADSVPDARTGPTTSVWVWVTIWVVGFWETMVIVDVIVMVVAASRTLWNGKC